MFDKRALLVLFLANFKSAESANILFVSAVASPSHHIWNRALAFGLVAKGHNVTLIGPDEDNLPRPHNYTFILLEGIYKFMDGTFDLNEMADMNSWQMLMEFQDWSVLQCKENLKTRGFSQLLSYPPDFKFDLIVIDVTIGSCLYPLIHRFNYPPTVGVTGFLLPIYISHNFGNAIHPSYIPWYALPYDHQMGFWQRIVNSFWTHFDICYRQIKEYPMEEEIARAVFKDAPSMHELERHISLVLANTDPILDLAQPLPPNIIAVGGLHTRKSQKIPQDLQKLLDNARSGVILFSLGTNIRSDKLDGRTREALLGAFSKLSETVIWKFESKIENLPKNVIVRKWLPQNDVLGHPNVKLFIGHGGALSTQETIFHGVPMICIPFIVDQHINCRLIASKNLGIRMDFKKITSHSILNSMREILDNPIYAENMRQASSRFRDRSETPLERAIFWVEYVLRHGGAQFLNTPARDMPYYQAAGLDVAGFFMLVIISLLLMVGLLAKTALYYTASKKKIKTN